MLISCSSAAHKPLISLSSAAYQLLISWSSDAHLPFIRRLSAANQPHISYSSAAHQPLINVHFCFFCTIFSSFTSTQAQNSFPYFTILVQQGRVFPVSGFFKCKEHLGKPSRKKSAVFLNIVQKAFAPPPLPLSFEHHVVNFS